MLTPEFLSLLTVGVPSTTQVFPHSLTEHTMSRGVNENNQLKGKLEAQLHRLLDQLEDIKKDRDNLEEEEYNELRNDTMEQVSRITSATLKSILDSNICQLEEFKTSLDKMSNGDLGLVDTVGAMQLAIQAAISEVSSS